MDFRCSDSPKVRVKIFYRLYVFNLIYLRSVLYSDKETGGPLFKILSNLQFFYPVGATLYTVFHKKTWQYICDHNSGKTFNF